MFETLLQHKYWRVEIRAIKHNIQKTLIQRGVTRQQSEPKTEGYRLNIPGESTCQIPIIWLHTVFSIGMLLSRSPFTGGYTDLIGIFKTEDKAWIVQAHEKLRSMAQSNQSKAVELRVLTCLEMLEHSDYYKRQHKTTGLHLVTQDYNDAVVDCAIDRNF
jgi:hypothetical protein